MLTIKAISITRSFPPVGTGETVITLSIILSAKGNIKNRGFGKVEDRQFCRAKKTLTTDNLPNSL